MSRRPAPSCPHLHTHLPTALCTPYPPRYTHLVAQIPKMSHNIVSHMPSSHARADATAFLNDMESMGADGWAMYLDEHERARDLEKTVRKLHKAADWYHEKYMMLKERLEFLMDKDFEEEWKKVFGVEFDEEALMAREDKREGRKVKGKGKEEGVEDDKSDIAALGHLQRDLNDILMEMRYLEAQAEAESEPAIGLRGGMGGDLEDEVHVYGKESRTSASGGHNTVTIADQYIQQLEAAVEMLENEIKRISSIGRQVSVIMERTREEYEQLRKESLESEPGMYEDIQPTVSFSHHNEPSLRGGSGSEHRGSSFDEHRSLANDFEGIYENLMRTTFKICGESPPSECTQAWTSVASILQTRNKHLERKLKEFRRINKSLGQDLYWNMNKLEELEESLEIVKAEKTNALVALGFERRKLERAEDKIRKLTHRKSPKQSVKGKEKAVGSESIENASTSPQVSSRQSSDTKVTTSSKATKSSDSDVWRKPVDYFIYFPRKAEILFPGYPHPLFHFSGANNLDQIRQALDYRHEKGMATDPFEIRIREIMITREEMGIMLPDDLTESSVIIGIPVGATPGSVDNKVELEAWIANEEADEACLRVHELWAKEHFAPGKGNAELHVRKYGHEFNSLDHIIDMALNPSGPFYCSCATIKPDCKQGQPASWFRNSSYVAPYVSVRGGGDEDDYDEYDDEDDEEYGIPCDDTDSEDDEVDHEDEASDPWDTFGKEKKEFTMLQEELEGFEMGPEDLHLSAPTAEDEVDQQLHLRGGGGDDLDLREYAEKWYPETKNPYWISQCHESATTSPSSLNSLPDR